MTSWQAAPATATPVREPVMRVKNLMKRFQRNDGSVVTAINDISFDVFPGESVVLLGPSGCGKTTLLRCIAGLEDPDGGVIEFNGNTVFSSEAGINLRAELRQMAMVFQSYALWPHMTILDNIAYPLRCLPSASRPGRKEIVERVTDIMKKVGIGGLEAQYPNTISGGQQQRVALCRALIAGTNMVLFDEPLSNVDAQIRERLRDELIEMQRTFRFASLFVTHDRHEAMVLADRVAVLNGGVVRQFDGPTDTYLHPADEFVARFVGPVNEIELSGHQTTGQAGEAVGQSPLGPIHGVLRADPAADLIAIWRPELAQLGAEEPTSPNRWKCEIEVAKFHGSQTEFSVKVGEHAFRVLSHGRPIPLPEGSTAWMSVEPGGVQFLARR